MSQRQRQQQTEQDEEERHNRKLEQHAVSSNNRGGRQEPSKQYIDTLIETDLDDGTQNLIANLTQPDFVLSRLNQDHLHQLKWWLHYIEEAIKAVHPPEEGISGKERALLFEDDTRDLDSLTDQDKIMLATAMEAVRTRVTRSLGGFEREKLNENVDVSRFERKTGKEDDDGFLSILPGL